MPVLGRPAAGGAPAWARPFTQGARNKLSNAVPAAAAEQADSLSLWFVHDPDPWAGHRIPHGDLRRIAVSIRGRRRVELHVANNRPVTVEPLGLVLKAGSWHLVVGDHGSTSVICLDELRATRLTKQRFDPPDGFALNGFWTAHVRTVQGP